MDSLYSILLSLNGELIERPLVLKYFKVSKAFFYPYIIFQIISISYQNKN